jgi:hypothetical protein
MADNYLERLLKNPDAHEYGQSEEVKDQALQDTIYWHGESVVHNNSERGIGAGATYIDEILVHLGEAEKSWIKPFVTDPDFLHGLVDAVRSRREEMGKDS